MANFELGPDTLGITLLVSGLAIILLILLLLHLVYRRQLPEQLPAIHPIFPNSLAQNGAVVLVQPGGKIIYTNPRARSCLGLHSEKLDLERLALRTQPSESFLGLCAAEGQARFSVDGRLVEGYSYFIPGENGGAMLVSWHPVQLIGRGTAHPSSDEANREIKDKSPLSFIEIISGLSQAMSAHLDLERTLQAILESVDQLVPAEYVVVTIYKEKENQLVPYRYTGLPGGPRQIEKMSGRCYPGEDFIAHLITQQAPVLIVGKEASQEAWLSIDRQQFPYQSYLGVPLALSGKIIGTLELGSMSPGYFSQEDLEILRLLSGQAASALHNALIYQEEQRRSTELAGLSRLTQSVREWRDQQDLFARLVENINPLLEVEILGFLVYDETRRLLKGQAPFQGLPPAFLELYQLPIPSKSPAEEIWLKQETLLSANPAEDERLQTLGLDHTARAAGMRQTVLAPLTSAGRLLGYLQAANKLDGSAFDQDDLRLLGIIAGQVAPIIDNANLIQQTRRRAQRAEALRRIASLASSAATLDEILEWSLQELAHLVQAEVAAIFLLNESQGVLRLHQTSVYGVPSEVSASLNRMPVDDPQFRLTVTASQRTFLTSHASQDQRILPLYQSLIQSLGIESAIDVPLVVQDRGIGEIMFAHQTVDFFHHNDILTVATAAGQLAGAIERSVLASQTDENLRRRIDQLTTLARVSHDINTTFDLEQLLLRVYAEALRTTRADCGTISLFKIKASEPGYPEIMFHLGDRCPPSNGTNPHNGVFHLVEHKVLESGDPFVVTEYSQATDPVEALQAGDPLLSPAHAGIGSALIVPIAYQGIVAGLIHLHAARRDHFDATSLEIVQALASQAAIAVRNIQRYQEQALSTALLDRRVEIMAKLLEASQGRQVDQPIEQLLEAIASGIQEYTSFEIVLISIYNPSSANLERVATAGIPLEAMQTLRTNPAPWHSLQNLLKEEFRLEGAYFIPHERMPVPPPDIHPYVASPLAGKQEQDRAWHPQDTFLFPLLGSGGEPLGLISLDKPRDGLRPDRSSIDSLEIFASQAALIIAAHQKLHSMQNTVDRLQQELERAQQSFDTAKSQLATLRQKDLEQTLAIQHLSQRAGRIQAGLDIAEIVNRQGERAEVLLSLAREILARLEMDSVLVAAAGVDGPQLIHCLGSIPPGANPEALLGQRNPLHYSLLSGELLLVANLAEDPGWQKVPLLKVLGAAGFICLPVSSAGRIEASLLALSHTPLSPFTAEDEQLFTLLSRQVSLAMQNLDLLSEARRRLREVNLLLDFTRQVASLEPEAILQTLVDSARQVVPAAHAGLVCLWDAEQNLLRPGAAAGFGDIQKLKEIAFSKDTSLPGLSFAHRESLLVGEVIFHQQYLLSAEDLLRYRDATGGKLPVSSLIIPLASPDRSTGEAGLPPVLGVLVLDNYKLASAFTTEDQALINSLTQQAALTLENIRLYQASAQHAGQLQALTGVAAMITSNLQREDLIASLLIQLQAVIPYDTGTLWLREDEQLAVKAALGFVDAEERVGLSVAVEDSLLFNEMITTGAPVYISDVREDPRFTALVEPAYLSWLAVPLIVKGDLIGVIALEKTQSNFYTSEAIHLVRTFAGQAAVALENAHLYEESVRRAAELDQRSQRLGMLNRLSTSLSGILDIDQIINLTLKELLQAVHASSVAAILSAETAGLRCDHSSSGRHKTISSFLLVAETPAFSDQLPLVLPPAPLFERLSQSLGVFTSMDVNQEAELLPLAGFLNVRRACSLLILPLPVGENLHGFLLCQSDHPYHFTTEEIELARTIANQSAIAIQNAQLFAETRRLTENLERRVLERTAQLAHEHQRTSTLLQIITELSASLDLEQVLNRTLIVLNEAIEAELVTCLVRRPGEKKLLHVASIGHSTSPAFTGEAAHFDPDQGLAGWILTQQKPALIADLLQDQHRLQPTEIESEFRSVIGVPLMIGTELLGALLLFHRQADHFSNSQLDLVQAAANQVAVAVNNTELYNLIRDQAEDLGNLLRNQQVETSRSKAILEAVAEGILVTDAGNKITLFNASAEQILNLPRQKVLGRSLDYFTGLFGKAASSWMETIRTWSGDPGAYQSGDSYIEQIILDDGRVVSVHLAPVLFRKEFFGTVSIFHDITHQVEVDRLKSDFVATVSHELRTPMTSIKGYVDILLMGAAGGLSEKQTHFLEVVKANTERLTILVNDLLDVSRIESGRVTLALQPLDLHELGEDLINDLYRRSLTDRKEMSFTLDAPAGLPRITGDAERVRQILSNILSNAYNFTPENGQVILRMRQVGAAVQVDVQDTGIGIPPAEQERVFERFYRGENLLVLSTSGTGLGLSIVKNLVEMHQGSIWLESSGLAGEGSTFSITLPLYQPEN